MGIPSELYGLWRFECPYCGEKFRYKQSFEKHKCPKKLEEEDGKE